jgi:hypothetical protein
VTIDARKHPANNIILLNDVRYERCLLSDGEDLTLFDHIVPSVTQRLGTRSRHLVTTCAPSCAGSSFAWPPVK